MKFLILYIENLIFVENSASLVSGWSFTPRNGKCAFGVDESENTVNVQTHISHQCRTLTKTSSLAEQGWDFHAENPGSTPVRRGLTIIKY